MNDVQLTVRPRLDADLPTLWRWLHGEENPEWQRWDGPYFPRAHQHKTLDEFIAEVAGTPASPNRQVIALNGECIGTVSRYEEDPAGDGRSRRFGGGPSAFLIR